MCLVKKTISIVDIEARMIKSPANHPNVLGQNPSIGAIPLKIGIPTPIIAELIDAAKIPKVT